MNNDKLILRALNFLLLKSQTFSEKEFQEKTEILEGIDQALNPKEDVPYEKSIEVCADCGIKELHHDPKNLLYDRTCKKFVKSSKGERE